jgi:hypothetical protein
MFAARLMAYASPKADKLWSEFALITTDFDNYMIGLRESTGLPHAQLSGAAREQLEKKFEEWRQKREELKATVRRELSK